MTASIASFKVRKKLAKVVSCNLKMSHKVNGIFKQFIWLSQRINDLTDLSDLKTKNQFDYQNFLDFFDCADCCSVHLFHSRINSSQFSKRRWKKNTILFRNSTYLTKMDLEGLQPHLRAELKEAFFRNIITSFVRMEFMVFH